MKVTIVSTQHNWEGMYIDDRLVIDGESIGAFDALDQVQDGQRFSLRMVVLNGAQQRVFKDLGDLPKSYEQLESWKHEPSSTCSHANTESHWSGLRRCADCKADLDPNARVL